MDDALPAGIAVFNAGHYHAAHDAWEDRWLDLASGTDDERFLHGLIQYTAAVYHARRGNWSGATGLATSAREYLSGLPADYRAVNVGAVRAYLRRLGADPELIERRSPPALTYRGRAVGLDDLDFPAAAVAALVLAEDDGRYDEEPVERAVRYAREELAGGTRTRFIALVMDFAADGANRDLIYRRLCDHVDRRRSRERDVDGLFDRRAGRTDDETDGDGGDDHETDGDGGGDDGGGCR
ncbi:MAG: DUF309 domain-containing protein [Salinigranum sp.]